MNEISVFPLVNLGEYVSFKTGKLNSNAAKLNGKYPFFTCSRDTYLTDTYSFDTECVLLGGNNANGIYPIFYYFGKFDAYQRTYVIQSLDKTKLINRFLFYALQLQLEILRSISTGAATKFLTLTILNTIEIPFPPLSTQQKIANILSAYDDLIENNTRRIKILEEMAQAIYREWFVSFRFPGHEGVLMVESDLGLVPDGWEVLPLSQALTLQRGFDLTSADRQEGSVPVYGSIGLSGYHNIAKVKAPGIVTGRSGTLGLVHYVEWDFWPHNTALWVNEFKKVTPLFTLFLLRSMDLKQYNGGVAVPTLDRNVVHRVPVIIPERKMIESFEEKVNPIFPLISNLEQQNATLRCTRDLLLPKLISGEIDVS